MKSSVQSSASQPGPNGHRAGLSHSIPPDRLRAQTEKIFESPGFFRSARMRRFLEFIVEQAVTSDENAAATLKESLIGIAVFDRDPSYDPKSDPIVRVEARRLRAKLVEYYEGPGKNDPIVIELPKGGYVPTVRQRAVISALPVETGGAKPPRGLKLAPQTIAVVGVAAIAVLMLALWRQEPRSDLAVTPIPLTSYEGSETGAAFSPDGKSIAYSWNGPAGDNFDIYTESIGSQRPRRLTSDPAADFSPRWSHDGRRIAFLRHRVGGPFAIIVIPAEGGPETKIAESLASFDVGDRELDWLPGDKSLVIVDRVPSGSSDAIFALEVASGRKRQLTFPASGQGDTDPSVSADGRQLVFVRDVGYGVSRLYVMALNKKSATARRLAWPEFGAALSTDPVWTSDGHRIVFTSNRGGPKQLWLADISGAPPQLLASLGENVSQPAISPRAGLAFTTATADTNIWRIDLPAAAEGGAKPEPVITSTRQEHRPQVSPDGSKIAFESDRSGSGQVWIANADASDPRQLTFFERGPAGSPRWSPDGSRIVFDSRVNGQAEIYDVPAAGGQPRQLTNNPFADILPVYSPDGRSIYFASNRSGSFQIWRMPASGGEPVQITRGGGSACQPSPDGKFLYFTRDASVTTSLWRIPVAGGKETLLLDSVLKRSFALTPAGDAIIFLRSRGETGLDRYLHATVNRLDLQSGKVRLLAALDHPAVAGLSISSDGRYAYFATIDGEASDLALVKGFH